MSEEAANSEIGDAASVQAKDATEESIPSDSKGASTVEPNIYNVKPSMEERVKPIVVQGLIREVLQTALRGKVYKEDSVKGWIKNISDSINQKVKDMRFKRYKHIVHVFLVEERGAGLQSGLKCIWDSETDNLVAEMFINYQGLIHPNIEVHFIKETLS